LAVDTKGDFVFRDIVVSTPRQQGKGWLTYALATARCHFASDLGGQQTVLHVANNLQAARRIHSLSWRWAEMAGLTVRMGIGIERVIWPDGSSWDLSSAKSVWGATASVAVADECWDLQPEVVTSALQPTMVEREGSQLWLTSTANEGSTSLMPDFRSRAIKGIGKMFIAEWSAPPEADPLDPEVWIAASPYWTEQRGELMTSARSTTGFKFQWINQWPDLDHGHTAWLPGWDALEPAMGDPRFGIGAIESSADRTVYGASVALKRDDGVVDVWTCSAPNLQAACDWLTEQQPVVVLAGLSIKDQVVVPATIQGVGVKETRYASPVLIESVRNGRVRHDHGDDMSQQVGWARLTKTEHGDVLSAKASEGPISTLKAACWATWAAATGAIAVEPPEIW
jgi:hypothetical protein